ncbi:hypothetical protein TNCV_3009801 [Trichonephila clavipes]|nr:hypothetical protein TNCV_3009801 [Trichonephila clavipes]
MWPLPPRPQLTSPKVLRSLKPHSKCQFSQGGVCCVIIPVVENHQTQLHSTQFWSATGLSRKTWGSKGERKEVKIAPERRVRKTRTHKRASPSQKITRVPRDCDTRTHLKKVSPLRGEAKTDGCLVTEGSDIEQL